MSNTSILKLSLFTLLWVFPISLTAQNNLEDVVYLKDGSVLRGSILHFEEAISLKIEIEGGSQFFILFDEVLEIKKEPKYQGSFYKKRGYFNQTGVDRLPGNAENSVRFIMIQGYQFNPHFSAGLGIGYTSYDDRLNTVPVFLDVKANVLKANTIPYAFFRTGYSFSSVEKSDSQIPIDKHKGGLMVNFGGGLLFETKVGYGLYINVGYNYEKLSYTEENFWWNLQTIENEITFQRVNFGFGLSF